MLLLFFTAILARMAEQCGIDNDGFTLVKYFQQWCPSCQKLDPVMEEISSRLDRHGSNIRVLKVDCGNCKCDADITSYPTVKLMLGQKEIAKFTGYRSYAEVSKFLLNNHNLDKKVFEGHIEKKSGIVYELTENDLSNGLDGPWLVLFYHQHHAMFDTLFEQIATVYDGQVNVGRIPYSHSKMFVNKFGIKGLPAIYGFLDGLNAPYLDPLTLNDLSKFVDRLTSHVLTNVTYEDFLEKVRLLDSGEPIYLVLHKSSTLAMEYFYRYAHEYKFRVNFYRSNDIKLFQRASLYPQEISDDAHNKDHSKALILTVYKNGMFYPYDGDIQDEDRINEWFFHSHFNYVTSIRNSNFGNVFHGIKPVMLLITRGEHLVNELNDFSADRHLGTPFSDVLYATIDADEFNLFLPSLLPKMNTPSLVFYDPLRKSFFYKKLPLDKNSFYKSAMELLRLYELGKLSTYPEKTSYVKYYILIAGIIISALGYLMTRKVTKKRI